MKRRPKPVHWATQILSHTTATALCTDAAIDPRQADWTTLRAGVTCPRCQALCDSQQPTLEQLRAMGPPEASTATWELPEEETDHPNRARDADIFRSRRAGERYRTIAARHGISISRVRAVYERGLWREEGEARLRALQKMIPGARRE